MANKICSLIVKCHHICWIRINKNKISQHSSIFLSFVKILINDEHVNCRLKLRIFILIHLGGLSFMSLENWTHHFHEMVDSGLPHHQHATWKDFMALNIKVNKPVYFLMACIFTLKNTKVLLYLPRAGLFNPIPYLPD